MFKEGVQHASRLSNKKKIGKMADENEDQWLYGDSADGKEYANIQSEIEQNDSIKIQEKSQSEEDIKIEGANETPPEVRA